jgi:hypothetical protein
MDRKSCSTLKEVKDNQEFPKTRRNRKDFSLEHIEGNIALPTPSVSVSGFCKSLNVCYLKPCSLWYFVMIALENKYKYMREN